MGSPHLSLFIAIWYNMGNQSNQCIPRFNVAVAVWGQATASVGNR
ncbi:MAG TPA: hypothetical protein VFB60_03660 [Ktedonobacteraceae bacterium]|nr:hypothetical protein [Ktedonobacteraceae bacterium]